VPKPKTLIILIALLLLTALSFITYRFNGGAREKVYDEAEAPGGAAVKRGVKPEADAEAVVLEVESGGFSFGRIVIELYPNVAPKMVERFKRLVKEGFYDGTAFHRVNARAGVVQGGDPNSKDEDPANDGLGGSPYEDLPAEFSDIPFDRGIVGAARADINSANSQFYITLRRVPQWDAQYTVFGKVVEGMSSADAIAGAPTRPAPYSENPAEKIVIKRATLQPRASFQKQ
jgi:cyclophilin family peptidyl-prolyl cis-trans isomerase